MAGAGTPPDSATTAIESIYRSDSDPGRASYSKKEDDFGDAIERASTVGRESLFGERTNSKEQDNGNNEDVEALQRTKSRTTEIWKFRLRAADDGEPQ